MVGQENESTCSTSLYCFYENICKLYILYVLCNVLAFVYKQVLWYWCALLFAVVPCLVCCRCAIVVLCIQVAMGVFFYVYWLYIVNIWKRPQYHHIHTWPWVATSSWYNTTKFPFLHVYICLAREIYAERVRCKNMKRSLQVFGDKWAHSGDDMKSGVKVTT